MNGLGKFYLSLPLLMLCTVALQHAYAENDLVTIPLGASHQNTGVFYSPTLIDIQVGDTVTWRNDDSAVHTVSSGTPNLGVDGRMDSGIMNPGSTFSHTFDKAGTYGYYCLIHPWMTGTINVGTDLPPQSPVTLSMSTDKLDYMLGDNITVSGQASRFVPNEVITIWVTDISGNGVASNHVSTETSDRFSATIIPNSLWVPGKEYVVNAQYGARGTVARTDVLYDLGKQEIPSFFKDIAGQWAVGSVSSDTFTAEIRSMISQGMVVPPQTYFVAESGQHIPEWVKNTASWWSQGKITDADFEGEIQYLVDTGDVRVG
ncbi:MAG TPA: plastocyanin/azurin family copper-binding protein [Candidatus Nitrosotalea sp.]|nr:plastocyanin/azurin family copper-binding protein [Candidatus Nitrosotalea sp.]